MADGCPTLTKIQGEEQKQFSVFKAQNSHQFCAAIHVAFFDVTHAHTTALAVLYFVGATILHYFYISTR